MLGDYALWFESKGLNHGENVVRPFLDKKGYIEREEEGGGRGGGKIQSYTVLHFYD